MDFGLCGAVAGKILVIPLKHIAELGLLKFSLEPEKKSEGSELRTQTALILQCYEKKVVFPFSLDVEITRGVQNLTQGEKSGICRPSSLLRFCSIGLSFI